MLIPYSKSHNTYHRYNVERVDTRCDGYTRIADMSNWCMTIPFPETLSSFKNTEWRKQVREGVCATTEMNGVREALSRSAGKCEVQALNCTSSDQWKLFKTTGDFVSPQRASDVDWPPLYAVTDGTVTEAEDVAKTKFLRKLLAKQTAFEGSVFSGEFHESLRMLKQPGRGLLEACGSWIKRAEKSASRLQRHPWKTRAKALADQYLEISFGMVPLLNDLEKAVDAFVKLGSPVRERVKASHQVEQPSVIWSGNQTSVFGNATLTYSIEQTGKAITTFIGAIKAGSIVTENTFRYWGLTPDRWAPTLYELMPWSWMLDYFGNLDEVIEAASARTSELAWVQKTSHKINSRTLKNENLSASSGYAVRSWLPSQWTSEFRKVHREQFFGSWYVSPRFNKVPYKPLQLANMAAVVVKEGLSFDRKYLRREGWETPTT